MKKLKNNELRAYVSAEDYHRLEQEALHRGLSISKTIRDCLREYLQLRHEMASALNNPGKAGDPHTGTIIHSLLARTEERIAAAIDRQAEKIHELQEQVFVLTAMMDRFYLGMMQHLPEISKEMAEGAIASAKRRHAKWLDAVEKFLKEEEKPSLSLDVSN